MTARRRAQAAALLVAALVVSMAAFARNAGHAAVTLARVRVGVPSYLFSDDLRSWEAIASRRDAVSVAVINPRSGPFVGLAPACAGRAPIDQGPQIGPNLAGKRKDDTFVPTLFRDDPPLAIGSLAYLSTLEEQFRRRAQVMKAAGIRVFGYVWMNANGADPTCQRTQDIIGNDIDAYRRLYGITDVFLDDSSPRCEPGVLTLQRSVAARVHANGGKVAANVGTAADACVAANADLVINFEHNSTEYLGSVTASWLAANAAVLRAANPSVEIWHLVHSSSDIDTDRVIDRARSSAFTDLLYVTDDRPTPRACDLEGSTWDSLYGTWPLVRADTASCGPRANGARRTFGEIATAIARRPPVRERPSPAPITRRV